MIEQEIARYFSRLSALTKIGLSKRFSSVNMNEADVGNLTSEVETDRTRQKIICRKTAGSYFNEFYIH